MPQSLARIYLHIVFSTKGRRPFLISPEVRQQLYAYLVGIGKKQGCFVQSVGGVEDHVHLLCRMSRTISLSAFIAELKRDSSIWIKTTKDGPTEFQWQDGYGAFSISPSHVEPLTRYIENQEEHHREVSFQDEFRNLLQKYQIEFDERYLWD
jgi:REP element-mobilizing transposase RayT